MAITITQAPFVNGIWKTFPSMSNPRGPRYRVTLRNGIASCDCKGWEFNGKCWHMDAYRQANARTVTNHMHTGWVTAPEDDDEGFE